MDAESARATAQQTVDDGIVVLKEHVRECPFGFYFPTDTVEHQRAGRIEDMLIGSCGVLVDRHSGEVHELGSVFDVEYWLEAYEKNLHLPHTVTVTKVFDRQRAADALCRLQMTYVILEEAHGDIWRIPKHYSSKDFRKAFDELPAAFDNQHLIFRLHELQ
ncbi:MAG: hypothetical protein CMJ78_00625 [Planctomycetaceae bacterium]|nr:hypothetical protein [Planctomycetaceae bacterium]